MPCFLLQLMAQHAPRGTALDILRIGNVARQFRSNVLCRELAELIVIKRQLL